MSCSELLSITDAGGPLAVDSLISSGSSKGSKISNEQHSEPSLALRRVGNICGQLVFESAPMDEDIDEKNETYTEIAK
jgi:hypothetical protein